MNYIYLIKTCNITDSLCCIQLNTIHHSNKFSLIENKTRYIFYINDLHTIMHKSLTLSDNLFNKPTLPNNPYTNTPISIANLYNFYFFCKHNHIMLDHALKHLNKQLRDTYTL